VHTFAGLKLGMLLALADASLAGGQSSVTLAWDPSPNPVVVGYKLYQGVASRTYTITNDVGNATRATTGLLLPGSTYYFAVTAYDTNHLESPFSGEISYAVPGVLTNVAHMQLALNSSRQAVLAGTAPVSNSYIVLATKDFKTWTTNGTITVGAGGGFQFIDPAPTSHGMSFYRLRLVAAPPPGISLSTTAATIPAGGVATITATLVGYNGTPTLSWKDDQNNVLANGTSGIIGFGVWQLYKYTLDPNGMYLTVTNLWPLGGNPAGVIFTCTLGSASAQIRETLPGLGF